MENPSETIRLTQWAAATGCSCKIAPEVLRGIIGDAIAPTSDRLLVGAATSDDAAVYALDGGLCLISTTDFFTPIVDDAFQFGAIAATNALSDVWAMGGAPAFALAVLGWPVDKLPAALAARVMEGARSVCAQHNIPIAGGHSINSAEPFFGLVVNGTVERLHLKTNSGAGEGDLIFLTKPLGTGVLATAAKRGVLSHEHYSQMLDTLMLPNSIGTALGKVRGVRAMTDVTGFGLLGHLTEMCSGSGLTAEIIYSDLPFLPAAKEAAAKGVMPDATYRNWNAYSSGVHFEASVPMAEAFPLLADPQTNGGLLIAITPDAKAEVRELLTAAGLGDRTKAIGRFLPRSEKSIRVV